MIKLNVARALSLLGLALLIAMSSLLVGVGAGVAGAASLDALQAGADRLAALQNDDGGWDWPLDDGLANTTSPLNTIGPIGKGLAQAYLQTDGNSHRTALQGAGSLLLSKTNYFSPPDGYLALQLDEVFGGSTYTSFVNANYYGPLSSGAYDYKGLGTLYDTAGYVQMIRDSRAGQGIPNLAAWDLGMGIVGAASAGASTSEWIAGVKAEINELDGTQDDYAELGLAGAVHGLAFVDESFDPTGGDYASADSLSDLADILAGLPLTSGAHDGELLQRNAYAILALNEFNRSVHLGVIQSAADYLESVQKGTGGWGGTNPPDNGENNEITGEVMWAIAAAYPSYPIADGAPAAPTDLVATGVSENQIDLTWQSNSDNELGFRIWRKNRPLGFFYEIDAVGAGVTTYSDTDVVAGKECWYMVKAWNYTQGPLGPQETFSEYSNVAVAVAPSGGGCFIATAAYGSYLDGSVDTLRSFRDAYLENGFVSAYYSMSPPIAEFIDAHPALKPAVRAALLPAVATSGTAVGMTLGAKVAVLGLLLLLTSTVVAWLARRARAKT